MKTLEETLSKMASVGGIGQSLRKHLGAVGIREWSDFTRSSLYELRDHLASCGLASASQKTICAHVKSMLGRVKDDIDIPKDYAKILNVKASRCLKTYLTEEDLDKLEAVKTKTLKEEYTKQVFLISAYTGLRFSDATRLTPENIVGNSLHYSAKKTRKINAIPLKKGLAEKIAWVNAHPEAAITRSGYNKAIKTLCRWAGIDEEVFTVHGDVEHRGPKWKYISSHVARVSTATDLSKRGVRIGDIQQLLQHSSIQTTERYIIKDQVELSEDAMKFFE